MSLFKLAFIGFILLSFSSCLQKKLTNSNYGVVVYKLHFWDSTSNTFKSNPTYGPDHKIWYKDSMVISETVGININFSNNERSLAKSYYTFINLKTKEFYRYLNFSDTAKIIKRFIGPDSLEVDGVWNFFKRHGKYFKEKELRDTTINKKNFKRILAYSIEDDNRNEYLILYISCDNKNLLVQFDKELGDKLGCPILRVDTYPISKFGLSAELEFISKTFTADELKVFDAWEKNAKLNPVSK